MFHLSAYNSLFLYAHPLNQLTRSLTRCSRNRVKIAEAEKLVQDLNDNMTQEKSLFVGKAMVENANRPSQNSVVGVGVGIPIGGGVGLMGGGGGGAGMAGGGGAAAAAPAAAAPSTSSWSLTNILQQGGEMFTGGSSRKRARDH